MELDDHLFRREAGRLVSVLTRIFGAHNLALAEDVLQDAFCRAVETCSENLNCGAGDGRLQRSIFEPRCQWRVIPEKVSSSISEFSCACPNTLGDDQAASNVDARRQGCEAVLFHG